MNAMITFRGETIDIRKNIVNMSFEQKERGKLSLLQTLEEERQCITTARMSQSQSAQCGQCLISLWIALFCNGLGEAN